VLANITEFGKTPLFGIEALRDAGVAMALYPMTAYRAMARSAEIVYQTIREQGTQAPVIDRMLTRDELYERLGYHDYERRLDEMFARENDAG
jgi:methylisocitrate lyase